VYHGRPARVFLLLLLEEGKKEEADTAKMAVVHTGKMPVLQEK
jgi:hypothetical protein